MKLLFDKALILFAFLIMAFTGFSQITVVEEHNSDTTSYLAEGASNDSILVFYPNLDNGFDIKATLKAYYNSALIDTFNFEWFVFDYTDTVFIFDKREDSVAFSLYNNAPQGGYRVRITSHEDVTLVDTFTVWLNYQTFEKIDVYLNSSTCTELQLDADFDYEEEFTYFDLDGGQGLEKGKAIVYENTKTTAWFTIVVGEDEEEIEGEVSETLNTKAPTDITRYIIKVHDKFNYSKQGVFDIDFNSVDQFGNKVLIATEAKFKAIGPNDNEPKDTIQTIEAPRGVMFFNESSPTSELFQWEFKQHPDWIKRHPEDTVIAISDLFEPVDSIYYRDLPEFNIEQDSIVEFDAKLTAFGPISQLAEYNFITNDNRCVDSTVKIIKVYQSKFPLNDGKELLEMPNVFTPFNGGENDYFYFIDPEDGQGELLPKSIKYFSIKIYNRWGNKIYQYQDNDGSWQEDGKSEPGWDGITRFGGKVKPGVYYYQIEAEGYNNYPFESYGFFHVFY